MMMIFRESGSSHHHHQLKKIFLRITTVWIVSKAYENAAQEEKRSTIRRSFKSSEGKAGAVGLRTEHQGHNDVMMMISGRSRRGEREHFIHLHT